MTETAKSAGEKDAAEQKGRADTKIKRVIQEAEIIEPEDNKETSGKKEIEELENTESAVDNETGSNDEPDQDGVCSDDNTNDKVDKEASEDVDSDDNNAKRQREQESTDEYSSCDDTEEIKKKLADDIFLESVREQVENCKEELQSALRKSLREEFKIIVERQVAKANRRRRWNNFFHDIVIILLVVVAVYFGYCLYDVRYFDFMQPNCEQNTTCSDGKVDDDIQTAGPVKDATWYIANYSYLFNNLQTNLSADNVMAYYLYSDDYKVGEIKPEYLLAMAYNQVMLDSSISNFMVTVTDAEMQRAFRETFGTLEYYERTDFRYGCLDFSFSKTENAFVAESVTCSTNQRRTIVENIEHIYEEGEVIYVLTNAGIYDSNEQNLYSFDNLFQPIASNIQSNDLTTYTTGMNRYQYQFKKSGDNYYFSSITKLN